MTICGDVRGKAITDPVLVVCPRLLWYELVVPCNLTCKEDRWLEISRSDMSLGKLNCHVFSSSKEGAKCIM